MVKHDCRLKLLMIYMSLKEKMNYKEKRSSDLLLGSAVTYAKHKARDQSLCLRLSMDENATMNVS